MVHIRSILALIEGSSSITDLTNSVLNVAVRVAKVVVAAHPLLHLKSATMCVSLTFKELSSAPILLFG